MDLSDQLGFATLGNCLEIGGTSIGAGENESQLISPTLGFCGLQQEPDYIYSEVHIYLLLIDVLNRQLRNGPFVLVLRAFHTQPDPARENKEFSSPVPARH